METPLPSSLRPRSLAQIRERLARHTPRQLEESSALAHAAVALVLRVDAEGKGPELLIIRRAEHPLDPWSGHLGFPGGRMEPQDASPQHTAVRETQEELGISLDSCGKLLGRLSELRARSLARLMPLSIFPFVYELVEPAPLQWNGEVVAAHWIPLDFFLDASNRSTMPHPREPEQTLPCYPLGDRAIWGLSLAMIEELLFEALNG